MPLAYKHCSACGGGPWPPHRFYRAGKNKAGKVRRDSHCKKCRAEFNRDSRLLKAERWRQYDQRRAKTPAFIAQQKAYAQTPAGKAAKRRATRAWRITHPEAYAAQKKRSAEARRRKRLVAVTDWANQPHTTAEPAHTAPG